MKRIIVQRCPWRRARKECTKIDGVVLCVILLLVALGAGHFPSDNAPGPNLRVQITGAVADTSPFWR